MLRGLLFLIVVGAIIIAAWSFLRRSVRREDFPTERSREPVQRSLPAPDQLQEGALSSTEVFARFHELALGVPVSGAPPSLEHEEVVASTSVTLASVATEPRYAMRRPLLLPQLMQAINDTEISRRELANIIARDPGLTGSLLKLANSSFYRINAQPVESVDRAVAILGTEGIRSLIASAIMQPVFRVPGGAFSAFPEVTWEHTIRSGAAAEAHAAIVENTDPFAAQLLGLLLGLATIVVFRVTLDQYAERPKLTPDAGVIASLLNARAAEVAGRIAASWELSGRILEALEDQQPDASTREPTPLGRSLSFGRLVGALAVLHANNRMTEDTAKATLLASGASGAYVERIWARLTARPAKGDREPPVRMR